MTNYSVCLMIKCGVCLMIKCGVCMVINCRMCLLMNHVFDGELCMFADRVNVS